jgi:hypothetical protein
MLEKEIFVERYSSIYTFNHSIIFTKNLEVTKIFVNLHQNFLIKDVRKY